MPMHSASTIRLQIETALAHKIPSALTPQQRMVRPVSSTGIETLDDVLLGGLPVGAISELVGPEGSGRTSLALSFVAGMNRASKVCAWIDVTNALDPISAASIGVDLSRLLWVRCGATYQSAPRVTHNFALQQEELLMPPTAKKGLYGGSFGPHPRTEAKGMSKAVSSFLQPKPASARCGEPPHRKPPVSEASEPGMREPAASVALATQPTKLWSRMEQALRTTDLLLQGGGFSAIVLDMGSLAPEAVSRVPLATWHRYRVAAERTQSSIVLLTQYACAKSSAELVLRLEQGDALADESTVFVGIKYSAEVVRRRFNEMPAKVVPMRKPPQRVDAARWNSRTAWTGCR